jgi:hypothetical protein
MGYEELKWRTYVNNGFGRKWKGNGRGRFKGISVGLYAKSQ